MNFHWTDEMAFTFFMLVTIFMLGAMTYMHHYYEKQDQKKEKKS